MSIATDKARIEGAKTDLAAWLTEKGVTVPSNAKIDGMVGLLGDVQTGGGGGVGASYTVPVNNAENNWTSTTGDAIASGRTETSYYYLCKTKDAFLPGSATWEMQAKVKIDAVSGYARTPFGAPGGFCYLPSFEIQANKRTMWAGVNLTNSSWDYGTITDFALALGVWYWIRFGYNGSYYYLSVSTDGVVFNEISTIDYSGPCYQGMNSVYCCGGVAGSYNHYFSRDGAYMDMSETYIKIGGKIWWCATLDTGGNGGEKVDLILQEKTVTPSLTQQIILADEDYPGLSKVIVKATSDNNLADNERVYRIENATGTLPQTITLSAYAVGRNNATIDARTLSMWDYNNQYIEVVNNNMVLKTSYSYGAEESVIDSGALSIVAIPTSDKAEIGSVVIANEI